jgi:hypothetical protein
VTPTTGACATWLPRRGRAGSSLDESARLPAAIIFSASQRAGGALFVAALFTGWANAAQAVASMSLDTPDAGGEDPELDPQPPLTADERETLTEPTPLDMALVGSPTARAPLRGQLQQGLPRRDAVQACHHRRCRVFEAMVVAIRSYAGRGRACSQGTADLHAGEPYMNASGEFEEESCAHMPFEGLEGRGLDAGVLVRQKKGGPDANGDVHLVISFRLLHWFELNKLSDQPDQERKPKRCHANVEVSVPGDNPRSSYNGAPNLDLEHQHHQRPLDWVTIACYSERQRWLNSSMASLGPYCIGVAKQLLGYRGSLLHSKGG